MSYRPRHVIFSLLILSLITSTSPAVDVSIFTDGTTPQIQFAARELAATLTSLNHIPRLHTFDTIRDDAAGQLQKVPVPAETIGAAMINYCRKVNVPLPREGKKSLLVSGDNLVLVVNVQAQPTKLFRTGTAEH